MHRLLIAFSLILASSCAPKTSNKPAGLKNASIINGAEVKSSDTLASSIVGVYNTKEKMICTGTIIAPNIVLTAAHCVPERAFHVKIVFTNNIDDTMNTREQDMLRELVLSATDFKVSTKWDPKNDSIEFDTGDIALIKFKGEIPKGFKPAKFLTDENALKVGNMVTVAGFGVDEINSNQIDPKKYRNIDEAIEYGEVICDGELHSKNITCFEIEASGDGILRATSAPIASLFETEVRLDERKTGTCNGDSGGPAFIQSNGEYFLFGVTSRGSAFCNEVGVYTNALYYKNWIEETSKLLK
ncbi:MAG: trypsin-like serine protease [Bacteriovorax sp.]|jgi:secreted trypsin-like serine protease